MTIMIKSTGNYRIVKSIPGKKLKEISCGIKEEMEIKLQELTNDDAGCILQEEVYTTNSLKDESGRDVNSTPYWRKFR